MKFIQTLFILFFFYNTAFLQTNERFNIPVSSFGETVSLAFAGGLNDPQFSEVDLNNDGNLDLFIFDRIGNVPITFINQENEYVFAPEYSINFPNLKNFCLLRDYNGDGIMDIFAHSKSSESADGMVVYTGIYTDNKIDFERFDFWQLSQNIIPVPLANGLMSNLYVSNIDLPDINDIDGDGDLDVLAFDPSGGYLFYYTNQSVELGHGLDSLLYIKDDGCWGKFYESSMSEEVSLSSDPNICSTGFTGDDATERHAGSTTTTIDLDNDGDKELLIGDIINSYTFMLENGGDNEDAWITGQDNSFPSYDTPIFLPAFNATYIFDADFDGVKDMIAAPNTDNTPNYECSWLYKNVGTNEIPDFELQTTTFLTDKMLDFGSGAHPTFADVNGDGLQDLVVGSAGYYLTTGIRDPRLFLFLNTGTATNPAFDLVDDNWLNFQQYGDGAAEPTWAFTPTFGDLDSDGDLDLLVGEFYGAVFYGENIGGEGNPMDIPTITVKWKNLDVGLNSVPAIADLNRDGLLDIILGERNGNINFLPNIGTATEPDYHEEESEAPNLFFLGQVDAAQSGEGFGHSAPAFYDDNGEWIMFLGTRSQGILVYENIDPDNLDAAFSLNTNNNFDEIREGERTYATLADLNTDSQLDMIIGNMRGGLAAFGTAITTSVENVGNTNTFLLSPNPAQNTLRVSLEEWEGRAQQYSVYNTIGQLIKTGIFTQETNYISVNNFPNGIYFLEVSGRSAKFLVGK